MNWVSVLLVLLASTSPAASEGKKATFSGTLLGHDGRPMKRAGVYVFYSDVWEALEWSEADADGRYTLSTDRTGVLLLRFAGVHHQPETVAVWVDGPGETTLRVRLATVDHPADFGGLVLQSTTKSINQAPLRRAPDGSYAAEIETSEEHVAYVISTTSWPTLWLAGDTPDYVSTGHYKAPIYSEARPRSGKLRVQFDPASLPRSRAPAEVVFESSEAAEFSSIVVGTISRERRRRNIRNQAYETGLQPSDIEDDLAPLPGELRAAERRIHAESVALLRGALLVDYLHLTETSSRFDTKLIEEGLVEVGPQSPLWWWQSRVNGWELASRVGTAIGRTSRPAAHDGYLLRIVDGLPTEEMQGRIYGLLYTLLQSIEQGRFEYPLTLEADEDSIGNLSLESRALGQIAMRRFPEHRAVVARVRPDFSSGPALRPGSPVPSFSVPLLGAKGGRLRDSDVTAKIYLVDFWATWCAPCLEAIPALSALYEEYGTRGFEILSYSFDDNEAIVEGFRREKHAMPWVHAMDPDQGFESDIARSFGIRVLPRSFLVDERRKVVRVDPSMQELRSYLEGALGE